MISVPRRELGRSVTIRDVVEDVQLLVVWRRQLRDPLVRHDHVRLWRHRVTEEAFRVVVGTHGAVRATAAVRVVLDERHVVHHTRLTQRLAHATLHKVAVALVVHEHDVDNLLRHGRRRSIRWVREAANEAALRLAVHQARHAARTQSRQHLPFPVVSAVAPPVSLGAQAAAHRSSSATHHAIPVFHIGTTTNRTNEPSKPGTGYAVAEGALKQPPHPKRAIAQKARKTHGRMAAMYTKMTATGSSLIVAPRTISKELEAKIATAVAAVIAKNDLNKLTTKMVRQHVEKEVKVSLTNHKEVLKRLMHQEFRRIKAEKAAKRVVPQPWKIKTRRQCMLKGLHRVYSMLRDQKTGEHNTTDLQLHAMLALFDLQAVEGFEVARVAGTYMRLLAASWLQTPLASEWSQNRVPTPNEILQGMYTVYTAERIGVSYPRRVDVLEFLDRTPPVYTAADFFGWDPTTSTPFSKPAESPYLLMATALLQCWFAHSLGTSLGCSFHQLLQHLPMFYPYKSPSDVSPEDYHDQAIMISTLVLVLTDFGKLKCEPDLLPHEYFFIRQHLVHHIVRQDISLMSTMLRALRCFEGSDNLISVRRGLALIILSQRPDGSWKPRGDEDSPSVVFRASILAIAALSEVRSQGYAPSIPDLVPLLELNLNADLPPVVLEDEKLKKAAAATTESTPNDTPTNQDEESSSQHSTPTGAGGITAASEESLEDQVRFHQSMLEKAGDNVKNVSAALAMQVLTTLSGMTLNVDILKNTGVGRTINKLRKHAHDEVAKSATQLVAKWKKDLL